MREVIINRQGPVYRHDGQPVMCSAFYPSRHKPDRLRVTRHDSPPPGVDSIRCALVEVRPDVYRLRVGDEEMTHDLFWHALELIWVESVGECEFWLTMESAS